MWRSADHLLAVQQYRPVQQTTTPSYRPLRQQAASPLASGQFVQQVCRLILAEGCNFAERVSWRDVWRVDMPCTEPPACPICLDVPESPHITECGHVMCLRCFLRHLQLSNPCACPICGKKPLMFIDLRPVRFQVAALPGAQCDSWTFRLVRRQGAQLSLASTTPPSDDALVKDGEPGSEFARRVVGDWEARLDYLHSTIAELEDLQRDGQLSTPRIIEHLQTQLCSRYSQSSSSQCFTSQATGDKTEHSKQDPKVFYQSCDGQQLFLEPSVTKELQHLHGGWGSMPQTVTLRPPFTLREEAVTEDLRWRYRFLSHLLGGTAVFVHGSLNDAVGGGGHDAVGKGSRGAPTSGYKAGKSRRGKGKGRRGGGGKSSGAEASAPADSDVNAGSQRPSLATDKAEGAWPEDVCDAWSSDGEV
eukprot:TRINITY_DN22985_c0_g1_i2.p1 TRINITY_DN22985_c0_g1~~TRINITY_DN22985_c0_g1_i2.p1  ORF type:complete len:418 (-),score=42.45 TRINITY_DN22985_c0_g1_i2:91-1344(-)